MLRKEIASSKPFSVDFDVFISALRNFELELGIDADDSVSNIDSLSLRVQFIYFLLYANNQNEEEVLEKALWEINISDKFLSIVEVFLDNNNGPIDSRKRRILTVLFSIYEIYFNQRNSEFTEEDLIRHLNSIYYKVLFECEEVNKFFDIPLVTIGHEIEFIDSAYDQLPGINVSRAYHELLSFSDLYGNRICSQSFSGILNSLENIQGYSNLRRILELLSKNHNINDKFTFEDLKKHLGSAYSNSLTRLHYRSWLPYYLHPEGEDHVELVSYPAINYRTLLRELLIAGKLKIISENMGIHITVGEVGLYRDNLDPMYLIPVIAATGLLSRDSLTKIFGKENLYPNSGLIDIDRFVRSCEMDGSYLDVSIEENHPKVSVIGFSERVDDPSLIRASLPFHRAKHSLRNKLEVYRNVNNGRGINYVEFRGLGIYQIDEFSKLSRVFRYIFYSSLAIAASQKTCEMRSKNEIKLASYWENHKSDILSVMKEMDFVDSSGKVIEILDMYLNDPDKLNMYYADLLGNMALIPAVHSPYRQRLLQSVLELCKNVHSIFK